MPTMKKRGSPRREIPAVELSLPPVKRGIIDLIKFS
jgi:hypothetical protein